MNYTTQMNAARQGIVTKEMETVAAYEGIDVKDIMAETEAVIANMQKLVK